MKNVKFDQDLHLKHGGTITMSWERQDGKAMGACQIVNGNMDGDLPDMVSVVLERPSVLSSGTVETRSISLSHEEAKAVAEFILKDLGRRL